jgi:ParB-like chromosome segregation protein Spo0J
MNRGRSSRDGIEEADPRDRGCLCACEQRQTLDPQKVEALAESIMEKGQQAPILVRPDGNRFVLVEGLHRLEACKARGETTVLAYLVQARQH